MVEKVRLKKLIGVYSVLLLITILYLVSPYEVNAQSCPNPDDVINNSGFLMFLVMIMVFLLVQMLLIIMIFLWIQLITMC